MSAVDGFLAAQGWHGASREALAGDASPRRYTRLARGGATAMLVEAPSDARVHGDFRRMSSWLRGLGLSAPEVYAHDDAVGLMLLEDLGTARLDDLAARDTGAEAGLYALATDVLAPIAEAKPPAGLEAMTPERMTQMVSPLFQAIADRGRAEALERAFTSLAPQVFRDALPAQRFVALRDYHAANLLHLRGREGLRALGLLDFQDAVLAPPGYDLASLVDDVRRAVPEGLRRALIDRHASDLGVQAGALRQQVDLLSLQRNLRVLGVLLRLGGRYSAYLSRCRELITRCAAAEGGALLREVSLATLEALATEGAAP